MTKTVMIVEDDAANMRLFHDLVETAGYATVQVSDGAEALAAVSKQRPDLVIMDIKLPNVSGLEVTKALKQDEDLRAIPVIAVTAFAMKNDEERIRRGGCDEYLSKPISTLQLLEMVKQYLS